MHDPARHRSDHTPCSSPPMVMATPSGYATVLGLLPMLIVGICTVWSMTAGLVPPCFPFTDGCLSISAACRSEPVIYFFRATMLPVSALSLYFWLKLVHLPDAFPVKGQRSWRLWRAIRICGAVGSVFLVLYVSFLGTDGRVYEFLRRVGVYVFFGGVAVAQLTVTLAITNRVMHRGAYAGTTNGPPEVTTGSRTMALAMLVSVLLMLLLGPLNMLLKATLEDPDAWENRIEWVFGVLLCGWYILWAGVWRQRSERWTASKIQPDSGGGSKL